jgi:hypothetical protein
VVGREACRVNGSRPSLGHPLPLLRCVARLALIAALLVSTALTTGGAAPAGDAPALVHLELPAPTGQYRLGTVSLHLVDPSRRDPWVSSPARLLATQPITPLLAYE